MKTNQFTTVNAVPLDDVLGAKQLKKTIILKVAAEGAEPEVVEGANRLLPEVDYVTVDCGFERGLLQEDTFLEVYKKLRRHGFEICALNMRHRHTI